MDDGTAAYLPVPTCGDGRTYLFNPTSISNTGQSAGGSHEITYTDPNNVSYGGVIWTLTGATGSNYANTDSGINSIANQNIAVRSLEYYSVLGQGTSLRTNTCGQKLVFANVINDSGVIGGTELGNDPDLVMKIGGCPTAVPNLAPGSSYISAITKNGDLLIAGNAERWRVHVHMHSHGVVGEVDGESFKTAGPLKAASDA